MRSETVAQDRGITLLRSRHGVIVLVAGMRRRVYQIKADGRLGRIFIKKRKFPFGRLTTVVERQHIRRLVIESRKQLVYHERKGWKTRYDTGLYLDLIGQQPSEPLVGLEEIGATGGVPEIVQSVKLEIERELEL